MKEYRILNLGAGVQSTAVYLMSVRQDEPEHVPVFDYAIFADTGDEPEGVYAHLDRLVALGGPPIIVRSNGNLGDLVIGGLNATGQSTLPYSLIPTFRLNDGKRQMSRRQCTMEMKVRVVEKTIRREILGLKHGQRIAKGVKVHQYYGLSYDEGARLASHKLRFHDHPWSIPHYPVFDLEMTRRDCEAFNSERLPGARVVRSACVYCPFKSDAEWRDMRDNDPKGWARSLEVDAALNARGEFIHKSCRPLSEAPIDSGGDIPGQGLLGFAHECEGMCGL